MAVEARTTGVIASKARGHDEVIVTFNDRKLTDAHIVDLAFINDGHKDISSKDFDAEKPLKIELGATLIGRLRSSGGDQPEIFQLDTESNQVLVMPTKVAVRGRHHVRLLVEGEPSIALGSNPLLDTDASLGTPDRKRGPRKVLVLATIGFLTSALNIALNTTLISMSNNNRIQTEDIGLGFTWVTSPTWASALAIVNLLSFAIAPLVMVATIVAVYRLVRRNKRTDAAFE